MKKKLLFGILSLLILATLSARDEDIWNRSIAKFSGIVSLIRENYYRDVDEEKLTDEFKQKSDKEFEAAENAPEYKLDEVFDTMFEQMPDELKRQKHAYESFLLNKEKSQ